MNFTPALSAFQGAILSADNVHQFARLTAKGGNEDQIEYVVESVSTFLEQGHYIHNGQVSKQGDTEMRRFAFYIVLNADLPVLQQLMEMDGISALIWTTPTIPKCLMCELMWSFHMENYVFEIISFTTPQLALEVASAFLDNFKYFDPLECLTPLRLLSSACYQLICRLHLFNLEHADLSSKSTAALNNFQRCLKYFTTPPNNYKLNALRKVELYKYQGRSLYALLQVIDDCLTDFKSKLKMTLPGSEVYALTYAEGSVNKATPTFDICESPNNILIECLNNANIALLDTCKVLVMDVSVDVFCCWSEFEENGKSMQQTVGELCYKVHSKLSNVTSLSEHPLLSMFEQIARKPVEIEETINATENDVILQNINKNDDESKTWIKALIHKDKLCDNLDLLNIVAANVEMYTEEESYILYTSLKRQINSNLESKDYVESLLVKVFQRCEISQKYIILEEHFSNAIFTDMKLSDNFNNAMTSVFNKLIATPDADLTDVLTIFLQSPKQVLRKIFLLASENVQQTEIMLKVIRLFEKFANHYYNNETESCIIRITQEVLDNHLDVEVKRSNFVKFICGLKHANIIPGTKLLMLIVMTNMHKSLLKKDTNSLNLQIKLLSEAYKHEELIEYRAPMLAMLAQVLDVVRWKINTFSAIAPATLDISLELLKSLLKTYDSGIPENESKWLKSRLNNLQPLNMYYYRILWGPPGVNYLEIVSGMTVGKDVSTDVLLLWLSQVICSCTQQEWCEIWDSLTPFDDSTALKIFQDAVAMITSAEKSNRTENSWACLMYCYRNFIYITRYKFFKERLTDSQVQAVINFVTTIAELINEENAQEFGTLLLPIFSYLTEKKDDYTIDLNECLNERLSHTGLSSVIKKVFSNGTG